MKTYLGDRTIDGVFVTVDGNDLPDYAEVCKFTNAGFEWSYEGSAATQLAFALIYDVTGDAGLAKSLAQPFMRTVTANFGNDWEMTDSDVLAAVAQVQSEKA
ncbi:DUF6166 domain-containing protein [Fluviibacterium sp. DFM31]|uniref:DUF6166 domain-containing protein n=1 Tax=Meridianimarinicoccus marinus TaxID=3231483 RepID=A0ABV3LBB1_9RHOB